MPIPPIEAHVSARARVIARGLIRTKRARRSGVVDQGVLRLECMISGYYWISLDGRRIRRGKTFRRAEELQPTFIDAMERAGR